MLISVLCFTSANLIIKSFPEIPFYQWAFFRAVFIFMVALVYLKAKKIPPTGNNKRLLLLRGLFGSFGILLFFYTLQSTTFGTAASLQYTSPIFAVIIAALFFNEVLGKFHVAAFLLAFLGVITMKFSEIELSLITATLGIVSAFCSGAAYNCIRQLQKTDHPMVVVFYFPLILIPLTLFYVVPQWVWPSRAAWIGIGVFASLNMVAQYLMTISYQQNQIKRVSILKYLGVILSFLFGALLFDEPLELLTILGAAMILGGLYLNKPVKTKANP